MQRWIQIYEYNLLRQFGLIQKSNYNRVQTIASQTQAIQPNDIKTIVIPHAILVTFQSIGSIGHRGAYGHEFLDFQLDSTGKLKYHNNSQYKSDQLIRKQVYVSQTVIEEMKRIILDSGIMDCDDKEWPKPDKIGKQQFVARINGKQVNLTTSKIGSYGEVQKTNDPDGLTVFFYLVQDLKCFVFSLVNLHFRIKPI